MPKVWFWGPTSSCVHHGLWFLDRERASGAAGEICTFQCPQQFGHRLEECGQVGWHIIFDRYICDIYICTYIFDDTCGLALTAEEWFFQATLKWCYEHCCNCTRVRAFFNGFDLVNASRFAHARLAEASSSFQDTTMMALYRCDQLLPHFSHSIGSPRLFFWFGWALNVALQTVSFQPFHDG